GEHKKVQLCAENLGSETIHNAQLELVHDNSISQFSAELNFDSYVDNKAIWTISEIAPESKQCFYVSFNAVSDESFELKANVSLDPSEVDANEENNRSVIQYKKGDTKSNAKHCNNGTAILEDEDYLHYKIGFKNEGESKAFDVKIVDEF